jgi:hypothetical protein
MYINHEIKNRKNCQNQHQQMKIYDAKWFLVIKILKHKVKEEKWISLSEVSIKFTLPHMFCFIDAPYLLFCSWFWVWNHKLYLSCDNCHKKWKKEKRKWRKREGSCWRLT